MLRPAEEVFSKYKEFIVKTSGDLSKPVREVCGLDQAHNQAIVFAGDLKNISKAVQTAAEVLVIPPQFESRVEEWMEQGKSFVFAKEIGILQLQISRDLYPEYA